MLLLAVLGAVARAEPVAVGGTLVRLALEDQHGEPAAVDEGVRVLVLSRDMKAGDVVKQALADVDQHFLDQHGAVYVADISGMPALVSKMFALPRMRARRYRVVLDRDGVTTRDLPSEKARPTVLFLDRLRVTRIVHPATAAELKAALAGAPGAAR